jgi:glutamine amidotransferase
VLFERSEEAPGEKGLGVLRGEVVRLRPRSAGQRLKVPHMGWNDVRASRKPHPLLQAAQAATPAPPTPAPQKPPAPRPRTTTRPGHAPAPRPFEPSANGVPFYFVHSYHALPEEPFLVAAIAEYGGVPVTAAVAAGNVFACQFHPEKSQGAGLALLAAFVGWQP